MFKNISLYIEDKEEIERFICVICLGIIESLLSKSITSEEAFYYFSSPYTVQILEKKGCSKELTEIVYSLVELDDVLRIVPNSYEKAVYNLKSRIIKYMCNLEKLGIPKDYWIVNDINPTPDK